MHFLRPLTTNRTSSHKVTNTIFPISHKKSFASVHKIYQHIVEKVCNVESSLKSSEKVIIAVVVDALIGGCTFPDRHNNFHLVVIQNKPLHKRQWERPPQSMLLLCC